MAYRHIPAWMTGLLGALFLIIGIIYIVLSYLIE